MVLLLLILQFSSQENKILITFQHEKLKIYLHWNSKSESDPLNNEQLIYFNIIIQYFYF